MMKPRLAIIIPCYNEEECISETTKRLLEVMHDLEKENIISENSFLFYISDGSTDNTLSLIRKYNTDTNGKVKGISFSRNFGNQEAIIAGLTEASKIGADCYISIDADLQQDELKIKEFIEKYNNGSQIVLGIRKDRKTDGIFKKYTALAFYKLMNILGVNIKVNHSDYRLVSNEIVKTLEQFNEKNLFLRGIFNEIGYKKDYVYFDVKPRKAGKSKFSPLSLFILAMNGIISFSTAPLRMVTYTGIIVALVSFAIGLSALIDKIIGNSVVPGWASIVVALGFIGGIQILCIGIIGEYLGQLLEEVKSRPRYIVEERLY